MWSKELNRLIIGFRKFKEKYFDTTNSLYRSLALGQSPKTLIIACSDSRVDPALITSADPGDLFVVRNVANLVPPYETALQGRHGVSAAIEFAVVNLKVENIVVLGHQHCGGIRALMSSDFMDENSFITKWMSIASPAKESVVKSEPISSSLEHLCGKCELGSIRISIENLKSFPFVKAAIASPGFRL